MSSLASFPREAPVDDDTIAYGPDIDDESTLRLLGPLEGRRVVVLGAVAPGALVALTRRGAHVIVVEPDAAVLDTARSHCTAAGVHVELHHGGLAELAVVRGDSVDVALSIYSLAAVDDLGRVFRQVHRTLRHECPLVLSVPHPLRTMLSPGDPTVVERPYFAEGPAHWTAAGTTGIDHTHTISAIHTALTRANFRTDALLEPPGVAGPAPSPYWDPVHERVPSTLIIRARKLGA